MKILIAPDSFKGSLSAVDFCHIVAGNIQSINPGVQNQLIPMADGGEGTIDAILANKPGKNVLVKVQNPLGQSIEARYAILSEQHNEQQSEQINQLINEPKTAVIEMAQASGLPLIPIDKRNPMITSSYGTGELILDALDQGCCRIIIGLGGSATNDAGMGMLHALGVRFLDARQQVIHPCGQGLKLIDTIDASEFDPRIYKCEFIIAGDVINPLCGDEGATYTYGPQKGADTKMLSELESGMCHFAAKTIDFTKTSNTSPTEGLKKYGANLAAAPGSGAAGGMGFALMAFCQAKMESGFELIAQMTELWDWFKSHDTKPDLIITGEGRFDNQSLQGKLVGRLGQYAERYEVPMVVICGSIDENVKMTEISQNISLFSICQGPVSLDFAMNNTPLLLERLIINLAKVFFSMDKKNS